MSDFRRGERVIRYERWNSNGNIERVAVFDCKSAVAIITRMPTVNTTASSLQIVRNAHHEIAELTELSNDLIVVVRL